MFYAFLLLSITIIFAPIFYFKKKAVGAYAAVAGCSGGHIIPALTILGKLKEHDKNSKILFFSTNNILDNTILRKNKIVDAHINLDLPNVTKKTLFYYPLFLGLSIFAFMRSFFLLCSFNPRELISTGGYVSIPVCVAAWLLKIPIVLYELNVTPGKASKFLGPLASSIIVCFPEAKSSFGGNKTQVSNYPVRFNAEILTIDKLKARQILQVDRNKKTLFIIGGSQGSEFINNLIKDWVKNNHDLSNIQIIHQTGKNNLKDLVNFYHEEKVKAYLFDYKEDINLCYSAADIIVSRAGAGSLAEIIFFKKQAIVIPLFTKENQHQVENGRSIQITHPELIKVCDQRIIEKDKSKFFDLLNNLLSKITY